MQGPIDTGEISEAVESWSRASEAKEQRSTLAEAEEEKRLDSSVYMTESGLASRTLNPDLCSGIVNFTTSSFTLES